MVDTAAGHEERGTSGVRMRHHGNEFVDDRVGGRHAVGGGGGGGRGGGAEGEYRSFSDHGLGRVVAEVLVLVGLDLGGGDLAFLVHLRGGRGVAAVSLEAWLN